MVMKATTIKLFFGFFLLFSTHLFAQKTRLMSGILSDSEGNPLPGVNITIKGTAKGTITDMNGAYSLEAPIGSTLVISYIGFTSKEIIVGPEPDSPPSFDKKEQPLKKIFGHIIDGDPEKTASPYFLVKSHDREADKLPLKSTKTEVNIAGVIADGCNQAKICKYRKFNT